MNDVAWIKPYNSYRSNTQERRQAGCDLDRSAWLGAALSQAPLSCLGVGGRPAMTASAGTG